MARLHLVVGIGGVAAFLLTGLYMRLEFPGAYDGDATMRMLFRSAHIYLLLASLMNVLVGVHASDVRTKAPRRAGVAPPARWRRAGSVLLLLAPLFFLLAFAIEPEVGRVERPYALAGAVAALAGTSIHLVSSRSARAARTVTQRQREKA
jgi:DMSO reductase anchor subunit